jgi:hypothetical protein
VADVQHNNNYMPDRVYEPTTGASGIQPGEVKDTSAVLQDAVNPGGDGAQRQATAGHRGTDASW